MALAVCSQESYLVLSTPFSTQFLLVLLGSFGIRELVSGAGSVCGAITQCVVTHQGGSLQARMRPMEVLFCVLVTFLISETKKPPDIQS